MITKIINISIYAASQMYNLLYLYIWILHSKTHSIFLFFIFLKFRKRCYVQQVKLKVWSKYQRRDGDSILWILGNRQQITLLEIMWSNYDYNYHIAFNHGIFNSLITIWDHLLNVYLFFDITSIVDFSWSLSSKASKRKKDLKLSERKNRTNLDTFEFQHNLPVTRIGDAGTY